MARRIASIAVFLSLAAALITGCSELSLSRELAGTLISASDQLNKPGSQAIALGVGSRRGSSQGYVDWDLVDAFKGLGYLVEQGDRIELTEKGRRASGDWSPYPYRSGLYLVPLATRELLGVTGIQQAENGSRAFCEFKWRWRWTPLFSELANTGGNPDTTDLILRLYEFFGFQEGAPGAFPERAGSARLERFDDGWRLSSLEL